jgi:mannan endo-1,4-beta-mannosidase
VLLTLVFSSCDTQEIPEQEPPAEEQKVSLQIYDKDATYETRALYSNLWKIQSVGVMFGHHDDLIYGREWSTVPGRSDVKEICGDYPAVFSLDFAEIMDDRNGTSTLNTHRERAILEAYTRGEVITACAHLNNPGTGGDAWDNSDKSVVRRILENGSEVNIRFKSWLDNLAVFLNTLKDADGKLIPVIFRPFHEHTQSWSWWGSGCTTETEFISLWRFTVDYLKNQKNVHNLIYAISPQLDSPGTIENILFRWPGDHYVDFIGMDCYHGTNTPALTTNLRNLEKISSEKMKPCGVTETGVEGIRKNGIEIHDYWTEQILSPFTGRKISMVVMWRNKYDPTHTGNHYYGPWSGHASAPDFLEFHKSPITLFSKDLPDMYKMADGVTVD